MATKNRHVSVTRITPQAAMRLGLPQSVAEEYLVQLSRGSDQRTEEVETLECVRPRAERGDSRIFQLDMIIGWKDWERLRVFLFSGWVDNPGSACERSAPASKWHLRVNLRGAGKPQCEAGSSVVEDQDHARGHGEVGADDPLFLHDICESGIR